MTAALVGGRLVAGDRNARPDHGAGASTSQRTAVTRIVHVPTVYGIQRFGKRPIMPPTWGYTRPLYGGRLDLPRVQVPLPESHKAANSPRGHR
jgi:hypothetical protein